MNLLGKACDKNFWKEVREKDCYAFFREQVEHCYHEKYESAEYTADKYSEFKMFFTTGNRTVYEKHFFDKSMAMNSAALLALIYPDEDKYINALMDLIFTICDRYTWCLPAHQGQNEYNDNSHIDLFAAETAFSLAEIYTLLGDRLDSVIKSRIETEIKRRVFDSYEAEAPYKHWEHCTNNWAAVCTASVAGAYMLMKPERVESLLPRFERAMECFLSGYKDDGVCSEGCGYWNYGFGYFVMYADMIKSFTSGKIDHFANPKVKSISMFIQNMFLSEDTSVSFSDAGKSARYALGIVHYLKKIYPDDVLVYDLEYSTILLSDARISYALRSATWFEPEYAAHPDEINADKVFVANDTEWLIKRNAKFGFAGKGGNNAEFHNHNDVGSFIIAKDGNHIFTDPGSAVYTRQYFVRETRYDVLETQSLGHSVPIINGVAQKAGEQYCARGFKFENDVFSFDMSDAYGILELKALNRSFSFSDSAVTLCDKFDFDSDSEVTERFILTCKPEVCDGYFVADGVKVSASAYESFEISSVTLTRGSKIYILDFKLARNADSFNMKIEM